MNAGRSLHGCYLESTQLAGRLLIAGNPRTSTNIVSFYGDDRLAAAFSDPKAVVEADAAPLQVRVALEMMCKAGDHDRLHAQLKVNVLSLSCTRLRTI